MWRVCPHLNVGAETLTEPSLSMLLITQTLSYYTDMLWCFFLFRQKEIKKCINDCIKGERAKPGGRRAIGISGQLTLQSYKCVERDWFFIMAMTFFLAKALLTFHCIVSCLSSPTIHQRNPSSSSTFSCCYLYLQSLLFSVPLWKDECSLSVLGLQPRA